MRRCITVETSAVAGDLEIYESRRRSEGQENSFFKNTDFLISWTPSCRSPELLSPDSSSMRRGITA
jgi:hypothetical protein